MVFVAISKTKLSQWGGTWQALCEAKPPAKTKQMETERSKSSLTAFLLPPWSFNLLFCTLITPFFAILKDTATGLMTLTVDPLSGS